MKAQVSLEFVTTYSWAIAIVLVMIGTVTYLGVFDTNMFLQPYCEISKELVCNDYGLEPNIVKLQLRNNFERDIEIHNLSIFTGFGDNFQNCDFSGSPVPIAIGSTADISCTWPSNVLNTGSKERVGIMIGYGRAGGSTTYTVTGAVLDAPI